MTLSLEARILGERVLAFYDRPGSWCQGRGSLTDVEGNVVARCLISAIYDLGPVGTGPTADELKNAVKKANAWPSVIAGNDTICKSIEDARKAVRNALKSA